jgi:uncharacterized membrane protein YcjF (UPF0283 family)
MKIKPFSWITIIILLSATLWLLFNIELWAKEWRDMFFYQDNWIMLTFVIIMVIAIGMIIKILFRESFKVLK